MSIIGQTPYAEAYDWWDFISTSVLVCDDHAPTRVQIRAFLSSRSINVCGEAMDGKDAIEKVRELKPSLVLLDIYMPQVSGVAAAYEIRKIAPDTKIVFFSNYDEPKHQDSCRILGGDAFVSKSAGIIGLMATLAQFLRTPMPKPDHTWWYEIRNAENHITELRRGFSTRAEAEAAGNRALKAILSISPGRALKLVTGTDESEATPLGLPGPD